jgi:hypothetical protein
MPDTRDAGAVAGETGGIVPTVEDTKDNKLDHRHLGDWGSRYAAAAWRQIGVEFAYLVIVLFGAITSSRGSAITSGRHRRSTSDPFHCSGWT